MNAIRTQAAQTVRLHLPILPPRINSSEVVVQTRLKNQGTTPATASLAHAIKSWKGGNFDIPRAFWFALNRTRARRIKPKPLTG